MLLYLLQDANQSDDWKATIAKATIIIAVATVLYFISTVLLWLTTRQSVRTTKNAFEAAHRPYIGMINIERKDVNDPRKILFIVKYQNVGSVPAYNCMPNTRVIVDGNVLPITTKEEKHFEVILPNLPRVALATVDDPMEIQSVQKAAVLSLIFKCTYKGVTQKEYSYEQKVTYDKEINDFIIINTAAN